MIAADSRLGAYRILARIGRGGMGEVYRARDDALARDVALKTIAPNFASEAGLVERFRTEAQAAARVSHANVVQVYSCGEHEGTLFFAMELVAGRSLAERLAEGPIPWAEATNYALQAARGLEAAAREGIIHRDVKPENLLLREDGVVKVADFGLAKVVAGAAISATGTMLGTPRYMSPERAQALPVDFRADMYSLGATVFHLVSGRPVFDGPTPMSVCLKHVNEPAPPLANAPASLGNVVARLLAKAPGARYASYGALIHELEAALTSAETPAAWSPPPELAPTIVSTPARLAGVSERVRQARAAAPLAPRHRRFLADVVELLPLFTIFAFLGFVPLPWPPVLQAALAIAAALAVDWALNPGERLAQVRRVKRTGGPPSLQAYAFAWFLTKATILTLFASWVAYDEIRELIPNTRRIMGCRTGVGMAAAIEYGTYLLTRVSVTDRMFSTRVVDVRGLPDEEDEE
ncbi:MAG TPA: serine/threonine-protein kinase [Planctomycetota bacterium]|nr:serine/threonine-protein kinase [Planctomycetota bacterium]